MLAGWVWVNTVSQYDFGLARYNPDGTLDASFGSGGKVVTPISNNLSELLRGMALAPGGKLVVTGDLYNPTNGNVQGNWDIVAVRYNPDGSLDASFDGDGKFIYGSTLGDRSESGGDTVVQPDGKILLTGKSHLRTESVPGGTASHTEMLVIRLNVNGSFDTSFGAGGVTFTDFGVVSPDPIVTRTGDSGEAITLQPDGKIVVAGEAVLGNGDHRFVIARFQNDIQPLAPRRTPFDFDGDGKADASVFRPSNATWYLQNSSSGFAAAQFGASTDKIVPADYDGDGKTDLAVYRAGTWHLQRSQAGFISVAFGAVEDAPVPADFDGDGKAELVVFRPANGTWYFSNLATNQTSALAFGKAGDKPVAADYDGDGKTDVAVFRNGVWYLQRSQAGFVGIQFGNETDKPVSADYDGDGKADIGVFRPDGGVWYWQGSQAGFAGIRFGFGTDAPVPADYDGDGKADVAVFRDGIWYLQRSQAGFTGVRFGASGDKPVPGAFVP